MRVTGPALNVADAAAYLGWAEETLRSKWRRHALIAASAVKDGRHLTFIRSGLDRYLEAHRVVRGRADAQLAQKAPVSA